MSMHCLALKFGACQVQELIDYLQHNAVHCNIVVIRSGTNLNWHNDLWVVSSVNTANNQAVSYNQRAVIPIDQAQQSIMN